MATSIRIKMATRGLVLVAFVVPVIYAQSRPINVTLTSSTTVSTADIAKEMTKQCPNVTLM